MFNASERTIRQWIVRYEAYGADGLNDKPRSGRPLKLSAAIQASVENDVRTDPAGLGMTTASGPSQVSGVQTQPSAACGKTRIRSAGKG